jgi:hypothetical protein
MNNLVNEAHQIAKDRGKNIMQEDIDDIYMILLGIELTDDQGQHDAAMIWEGISLIVNDPLYEGDARPLD